MLGEPAIIGGGATITSHKVHVHVHVHVVDIYTCSGEGVHN